MGTWHRSWKASIGLRAVGMALCSLAWAAIARLASYPPTAPGLIPYLLAGLGVISASAGGALAFLGPRLFTPVRVSAPWHRYPAPEAGDIRAALGRTAEVVIDDSSAAADRWAA